MDRKVCIYTTNRQFEAEIIVEYLSDRGIRGFILNKMDSNYHFGEIEILTDRDDVILAKRYIDEYLKNE